MNKLIKVKDVKKEKPFPKLMEYIRNKAYVYFKEPGVGVVVLDEKLFWGWYRVDGWNMSNFRDTDDQIILNVKELK